MSAPPSLLPPPDPSLLLMSLRPRVVRWFLNTFFGECATHIGIYAGGKVYHITYSKGLRISNLHNVLAANQLLEVGPLPPSCTLARVADASAVLERKPYNKALFWYMFFRVFCRFWGLPDRERFADPDKAMCADVVSFALDGELVSHRDSPTTVFRRYVARAHDEQRALALDEAV